MDRRGAAGGWHERAGLGALAPAGLWPDIERQAQVALGTSHHRVNRLLQRQAALAQAVGQRGQHRHHTAEVQPLQCVVGIKRGL